MLNREVIAIDQDALGIQGHMISRIRNIEIWTRPVLPIVGNEYSYAVAFVSRRTDGHAYSLQIKLKDLRLGNKAGYQVTVRKFIKIRFVYWPSNKHRISSITNASHMNSFKPTPSQNESIRRVQTSTNLFQSNELSISLNTSEVTAAIHWLANVLV